MNYEVTNKRTLKKEVITESELLKRANNLLIIPENNLTYYKAIQLLKEDNTDLTIYFKN